MLCQCPTAARTRVAELRHWAAAHTLPASLEELEDNAAYVVPMAYAQYPSVHAVVMTGKTQATDGRMHSC